VCVRNTVVQDESASKRGREGERERGREGETEKPKHYNLNPKL
jgi:hypothetical protein